MFKNEGEKHMAEAVSKGDLYVLAKQKTEAFRKPGERQINFALGRFFGTPEGKRCA